MPLTWAAPAFLAAAIVCSSMVAARANGVVPGRKFATVNPAPASMKRRRDKLRIVMTSSLEMSAFSPAVGSMLGRRFFGRNHGATIVRRDSAPSAAETSARRQCRYGCIGRGAQEGGDRGALVLGRKDALCGRDRGGEILAVPMADRRE